jgi:hypothetical protein
MGPEEQAATATINSKLRRLDNRKVDVDRYWGYLEHPMMNQYQHNGD